MKRIVYFDILNVTACFCVVRMHCYGRIHMFIHDNLWGAASIGAIFKRIDNKKSILLEVQKTGQISDEIIHTIDDPFIGLAELTQTISGENIFFFRFPRLSLCEKTLP